MADVLRIFADLAVRYKVGTPHDLSDPTQARVGVFREPPKPPIAAPAVGTDKPTLLEDGLFASASMARDGDTVAVCVHQMQFLRYERVFVMAVLKALRGQLASLDIYVPTSQSVPGLVSIQWPDEARPMFDELAKLPRLAHVGLHSGALGNCGDAFRRFLVRAPALQSLALTASVRAFSTTQSSASMQCDVDHRRPLLTDILLARRLRRLCLHSEALLLLPEDHGAGKAGLASHALDGDVEPGASPPDQAGLNDPDRGSEDEADDEAAPKYFALEELFAANDDIRGQTKEGVVAQIVARSPALRVLNIECVKLSDDRLLAPAIAACPRLEVLVIADCFLFDSQACAIMKEASQLPHLHSLNMSDNPFVILWYNHDRTKLPPALHTLILNRCPLSSVGCQQLSAALEGVSLQRVSISLSRRSHHPVAPWALTLLYTAYLGLLACGTLRYCCVPIFGDFCPDSLVALIGAAAACSTLNGLDASVSTVWSISEAMVNTALVALLRLATARPDLAVGIATTDDGCSPGPCIPTGASALHRVTVGPMLKNAQLAVRLLREPRQRGSLLEIVAIGNADMCEMLILGGARVNERNRDRNTALHIAANRSADRVTALDVAARILRVAWPGCQPVGPAKKPRAVTQPR
eukprot:m.51752 g.51752  ORF g.51752 m.51752 type:complete len:639 (-) comp6322_c0_seq2:26-1942(-)